MAHPEMARFASLIGEPSNRPGVGRRLFGEISLNPAAPPKDIRVRDHGDQKRPLYFEELRNRGRFTMKTVAILTALVTVMAVATANAKQLPPQTHPAGSPLVNGKYCWVYTAPQGYGFWDECDISFNYPRGKSMHDYPTELVLGAENGEGGAGGGGGGGGGGR
jgi:hypothetical protein